METLLRPSRVVLVVGLLFCLVRPLGLGVANAGVLISWDWNDGTTQGWAASSSTANVANQLLGVNIGNGSLQLFSPDISNLDITTLREISFDLTFLTFSTVASPSELQGFLSICPLIAGTLCLNWSLDFANLAFNQSRTFTLSIQDVSGSGSLANAGFFSLFFSDTGFQINSSSAVLDNFVVSSETATIPETSSIFLLGLGLIGINRERRVRRGAGYLYGAGRWISA